MTLEELQEKTTPIFDKYDIKYAGVFGSFARGEASPESDIDILIDYHKTPSLHQFIGLGEELEEKTGRKVDLVTEPGLSKYIGPNILKELKVFYGQR